MLVGLVLFPLALALTGFNEGDYVTRQEVLAKAREAAHPHDCLDTLAGRCFSCRAATSTAYPSGTLARAPALTWTT